MKYQQRKVSPQAPAGRQRARIIQVGLLAGVLVAMAACLPIYGEPTGAPAAQDDPHASAGAAAPGAAAAGGNGGAAVAAPGGMATTSIGATGSGPVAPAGIPITDPESGNPGPRDAGAADAATPVDAPPSSVADSRMSPADAPGASEPGASRPDAGGGPAPGPAGPLAAPMHWVVYGDSRTNPGTHQQIVDAYAKLNPDLVIHSGDLWDEYPGGPSQWAGIINKNPGIAKLLQKNLFLVSQGNHESPSEVLSFQPTLVRGGIQYSATIGDAFFVVLGMDPSDSKTVAFLAQKLASPEAKAARWRFVFSHYPVYSGGDHPINGYPALEKAIDAGKVTVYFSGHDHNYQRSYQLFGQTPVDTSDAVSASKGTVYVVTGGGGAPLYDVKKIANTKVVKSIEHFVEVSSSATAVTVKAWDINGQMIDTFSVGQ